MNNTAKKLLVATFILLVTLSVWQFLVGDTMHIDIDGDEFSGPFGALFGVALAGGGILIAAVAMACALVFVGLLCAGISVILVSVLVFASAAVVVAISPLMLPLLIVAGMYWFFKTRASKQRLQATCQQPA